MDLKKIEEEALHLPEEEKSQLIRKLLLSLDDLSDEEINTGWLQEAARRVKDIDQGLVTPVSAEEVMKKARTLLR